MVNLQELELKLKTEKEIENEYKTLPTLMNESLILKEDHLRKVIFFKEMKKKTQKQKSYFIKSIRKLPLILLKLNLI